MKTEDEILADNERIMRGEEPSEGSVNEVKEMPKAMKDWEKENLERIGAAKAKNTLPYFIKDNKRMFDIEGAVAAYQKSNIIGIGSGVAEYLSPVSNIPTSMNTLFEGFVKDNRGMFKSDVQFRKQNMGMNGAMMRTMTSVDSYGNRQDTIIISSADVVVTAKGHNMKFNPMKSLESAISKIRAGEGLQFHEEYAIESLWHEMLHARSSWWQNTDNQKDGRLLTSMETINQFCARCSYGKLLGSIGGKPKHFEAIMKNGFGYHNEVKNLLYLFEHCRIDRQKAYEFFQGKITSVKYDSIDSYIVSFIKDNSKMRGKEINNIVGKLYTDHCYFVRLLD